MLTKSIVHLVASAKIGLLGLLAIGLFCATSARADEQTAREAFERGIAASEAGDWSRARTEFQASARDEPKATTLFNLALAEVRLDLPAEALATLAAFDRVARPELHGHLIEKAADLRLVAEAAAERARLRTLERALAAQQAPPSTSAATAPRVDRGGTTAPGWWLVGVGSALTVGGVAIGVSWWRDRAHSLDKCRGERCPEEAQIHRQLRASIATTVVLSASGLALLSAGAVWIGLRGGERRRAAGAFALSLGLPGLSARVRF